jgi:hypothetical protein
VEVRKIYWGNFVSDRPHNTAVSVMDSNTSSIVSYTRPQFARCFLFKVSLWIILSITNKVQRCTIFFITVNAVHVSGGFSAHHQELKTVHAAYMSSLLAATASGSSKQALHIPDAVCTVFSSR